MAGSEPISVFESEPDAALEARLDEEAEASYAAGRFVEHATVVRWLRSWGTEDVLPPPAP
jgi:predicted transcriptional regulator